MPGHGYHHERFLLQALRDEWHTVNRDLLRGALLPPTLALSSNQEKLGSWNPRDRSITISLRAFYEHDWVGLRHILAHEMAHQYVHEVLEVHDETAHGAAFRRTCRYMGISARARGLPADGAETASRNRVLDKVQKLLALADSPNEHEARLAAAKAQRLMLKYNLDQGEANYGREFSFRQLGPVKGRFHAHEKILAGILGRFFFVECIWMHGCNVERGIQGRYLEVSGTPENLALASWVHAFVLETAQRLWREHKRKVGIKGNSERLRYLAGVMVGFKEQLEEQQSRNHEEGLIWMGDPSLQKFFRRTHPNVTRRPGPRMRLTEAWFDGKAAGKKIVIKRPLATGEEARGKLLEG